MNYLKRLFANVRRVIDAGRECGIRIVFIKDNFLPEEVPIDKHFKIFGPHCIIGTPDAEIVDALCVTFDRTGVVRPVCRSLSCTIRNPSNDAGKSGSGIGTSGYST